METYNFARSLPTWSVPFSSVGPHSQCDCIFVLEACERGVFFLSSLLFCIHGASQPHCLVPITLLIHQIKSSKIESQDVVTHQHSFVLEIIQFRKEKLVEIGARRSSTNSLVQFSLIFSFTD